MRLVFLCSSGMDNASPRGRWFPLARQLARMGHEPHLLLLHQTFDKLQPEERAYEQDGVRVAHVAQMHVYGPPGQRRYYGAPELLRVSWHGARALSQRAIELKPDVLHICKPQPINGAAGWLAARQLQLPFYVDCDDYEAEANRIRNPAQKKAVRWFEDTLPPRAAGVTVNTGFLYERAKRLGVGEARLAYVPNGADPLDGEVRDATFEQVTRILGDSPTVVYVGTMSTVAHGVDLLLKAFGTVVPRVPKAKLLMVGDGDDRAKLQAMAAHIGLGDSVVWTGRVSPEMSRRYFTLAVCSVDPVWDTPAAKGRSPLKIVESMSAGVPVVTGDIGDRRYMLADGAAGLLVPPSDAESLGNAISSLLKQPSLRAQLAEGALAQSTNYRWQALAEGWLTIYR